MNEYLPIRLIMKTENGDVPFKPMEEERIINHKLFNRTLPIVVFVSGFLTAYNTTCNEATEKIYRAYQCRGNFNFFVST